MGINPNNFRPEVQARKLADARDPEVQRRKDLWRAARGKKREQIAKWNADWNASGRPADFPDLETWRAMSNVERALTAIRCRFGQPKD